MDPFVLDAQTWATTQFAAADLHDKRRTVRLVLLATQITAHPSGSFPEQTESWNDLRAAYNLFDTEEVTFQAIATPHWELTKGTKGERLLIIADTTEIDYGPTAQVTGLSPVGSGIGQGFHLHSGLMVSTEDDRVHGLAGQLIYHRQPVPKGEKRSQRLKRDGRESQIWSQLVNQIGSPPSGTCWVHVVDRGADDFEFFNSCQQTGTDSVPREPSSRNNTPRRSRGYVRTFEGLDRQRGVQHPLDRIDPRRCVHLAHPHRPHGDWLGLDIFQGRANQTGCGHTQHAEGDRELSTPGRLLGPRHAVST